MDTVLSFIEKNPLVAELLSAIGIILLAYLAYLATRYLVIAIFKKAAKKTKTKLDDFIVNSKTLPRLSFVAPLMVVDSLSFLLPDIQELISKFTHIILLWIIILAISAFLGAVNTYYETKPKSKERPIKGYIQVVMIIIYIMGLILIIGSITNQSIWVLLSGIGAMTAVILLIFKDTILSFVAGIQITGYDLVHVGDWIEMPEYGADGDVIDIALHTVKVQNWDKTITVIPTHKLTENSFKNWRGMQQAGGRRIKRAIYIDKNSIAFCTDEMIERFGKIQFITEYVKQKKEELDKYNLEHKINDDVKVNGRRMTNIGTFRAYAEAYILQHSQINHTLTTMVRQLPPGTNGLPLEIYAFTNTTEWVSYESIQADIFDHLLSVVQEFDLQIFQNPSGQDFRRMGTLNSIH